MASTAPAPGGPNQATYASASLYVGDLNVDVPEAALFEIFNAVGPVASVRVCRDTATRRSLGYAYVNFHVVQDAERALDTLNHKAIRGRPCRIMWSHRDPALRKSGVGNIFVKNLAKSIDNKQLYDTFSIFGNILSCKVASNARGESLGYGFVHYESGEAAETAIQNVNGKIIAKQHVIVAAFKSRKERGVENSNSFTNIYVKNVPTSWNKEQLDKEFGAFGVITSSCLTLDKDGKVKGFGFVNFQAPEEAAAAIEGLSGKEFEGKELVCVRAQKKEERHKELRQKFDALKVEQQKKYAGVNLYVKNLADTIDPARLRKEFESFGAITSAVVMKDGAEKSRGFGFVCFSSPEEATKAVTEMNGRMVEGKPLYVALAQRKDERRAQLEAQHAARAKLSGVPQGAQMYPPHGAPMYFQQRPMVGYPPVPIIPGRGRFPDSHPGGNPPHGGMMGNVRGPMGGYQLVPMGGQQRQMPAGQRGGRGRGQRGQKNPMHQQQGQTPNVRYTDNVRNRNVAPAPVQQQAQHQQPAVVPEPAAAPSPNEPLTIKALVKAPAEQKKQMIGERLYPLIKARQPELAGKITGMLLEMDNGELIHLLESQEALNEKLEEACFVLSQHNTVDADAATTREA